MNGEDELCRLHQVMVLGREGDKKTERGSACEKISRTENRALGAHQEEVHKDEKLLSHMCEFTSENQRTHLHSLSIERYSCTLLAARRRRDGFCFCRAPLGPPTDQIADNKVVPNGPPL